LLITSSREIRLTEAAREELQRLAKSPAEAGRYKQAQKTIDLLATNSRHPSLNTDKFRSLAGPEGEDVFEAYVQNRTPGAYRVFFHYGPDRTEKGKRVAVDTIIAITSHS
jgi:hypothetical protein